MEYARGELERVGDPDKLPAPIRTVLLVQAAQGVIDNGGLQYFFEGDWPGQPPYSAFVDAYREIGAIEEAQTLANAVALFPFPEPHLSQRRRGEFLDQFLEGGDHRPDSPFAPLTRILCGDRQVWRRLEQYVRAHEELFPA